MPLDDVWTLAAKRPRRHICRTAEEHGPPIGDPAEPLWRSRRNARILSAVQRIGQRSAETAARTDRLRAAKRRHERLVQHLLYNTCEEDDVTATVGRRPILPKLTNDPPRATSESMRAAIPRDVPVADETEDKDNADAEVNKWLDSQIKSGSRWRRLLSLLRRQSALLSPTARSQLQLSASEELLVQRALQTEAAEDAEAEEARRTARRQLMLQVWEREAEHRHQAQGPPSRRCSEPETRHTPDESPAAARRRHQSAELPALEPTDWAEPTELPSTPEPEPEPEPSEEQPPQPSAPSFPMQDPGKQVEIKETEIQVRERSENEWTAEWDWAERERRSRARTTQMTRSEVSVTSEVSMTSQSSVTSESGQVTAQGSVVEENTDSQQQEQDQQQGPEQEKQETQLENQKQQQQTPDETGQQVEGDEESRSTE